MTNKEILQADLLDILFEHRNKAYGAYALRRNYNHRLLWALVIALSITSLFVWIKIGNETARNSTGTPPYVDLHPINLPKDPPKPPQSVQPKKPAQVAQIKSTQIKITSDDQVKKPEVPTINDLQNALTSTINKSGMAPDGSTSDSKAVTENENGSGKNNNEAEFHPTSSEAQFPGGVESFKKFLAKNLVTPDDLQVGEKKTVRVRFKVDVDGVISSAQILQSGGEKYDREVLRVLNKMPKWVPATQNGVKVPTWFTQPVSFIGVE